MSEYRVIWEIEVTANSPEGAVHIAQQMWPYADHDLQSTATVFVVNNLITGEGVAIDMGQPQPIAPRAEVVKIEWNHYNNDKNVLRDLWYLKSENFISGDEAQQAIRRHGNYVMTPVENFYLFGYFDDITIVEHVRYLVP